jgi:predicted HicB family RNase H-like nuclease
MLPRTATHITLAEGLCKANYITWRYMMAERTKRTKTETINLRVDAAIKARAERAAAADRRSLTSYIEKLIEDGVPIAPEIKALAERAAAAERRSLPNYIEKLIEDDAHTRFGGDAASRPRRGAKGEGAP